MAFHDSGKGGRGILVIVSGITVLLFALSVYFIHRDLNQCNDYHQNVPAVVISTNYTTAQKFGIISCQKCQNANIFPSCDDKIIKRENGSCHKAGRNLCKKQSFSWIDQFNNTHHEKYTNRNRYNYYEHCIVSDYEEYYITAIIEYNISSVTYYHNIVSVCSNIVETCLNNTLENNQIGSLTTINAMSDGTIKDMSCGIGEQAIAIIIVTIIFMLFIGMIGLCYINQYIKHRKIERFQQRFQSYDV